jgi:hypothetical protein
MLPTSWDKPNNDVEDSRPHLCARRCTLATACPFRGADTLRIRKREPDQWQLRTGGTMLPLRARTHGTRAGPVTGRTRQSRASRAVRACVSVRACAVARAGWPAHACGGPASPAPRVVPLNRPGSSVACCSIKQHLPSPIFWHG